MLQRLNNAQSTNSSINANLDSWQKIESKFNKGGILLGNGFSCAVWDKFGYSSLYEKACSEDGEVQNPLSSEDKQLFNSMNTRNFERILSILSSTSAVNKIFGQDYELFNNRYEHIKTALGEAVRAVHVPWNRVDKQVLTKIRKELKNYKYVYSTNYDLLIYWAVMSEGDGVGFKDYFWSPERVFDITDTEVYDDSVTRILYLHGALHLYRDPDSERTYKHTNKGFQNLLDILNVPLFITEGSSSDKLRSIRSSDYLSFAYNRLLQHSDPLVIFGHSLGESDEHLIKAIRTGKTKKIAISIQSHHDIDKILQKKALYLNLCNGFSHDRRPELFFFDAATHPLGLPEIKVK